MDAIDDASNEGRVTRARRKRLISVDSEASSRPGTPMSPQRTLRGNMKNETDALPKRITRRNSITNTPKKTPSKTTEIEFIDVGTPSSRNRRHTLSIQDDNTPQKLSKQLQLTVLPEEDIKEKQIDKKTVKHNTEKSTKMGKSKSPSKNVVKSSNKTIGRRKKDLRTKIDSDSDSEIEVIILGDTSNESLHIDHIESEPSRDTVADKNSTDELSKSPRKAKSNKDNSKSSSAITIDSKTTLPSNMKQIKVCLVRTPDSSMVTSEQSKSLNSKSVTFENSEILDESKVYFPKTPVVPKRASPLIDSKIDDNKRILKLTDSMLESGDEDDNEMGQETNMSKNDQLEKNESLSTQDVKENNTMHSETPTPEKLLRSGKNYGESPTSEHNLSKEMEVETQLETEIKKPKKAQLSLTKSPTSKLLNKSNDNDVELALVTTKSPKHDKTMDAIAVQYDFDNSNQKQSRTLKLVPSLSIENNSTNDSNQVVETESVEDIQKQQKENLNSTLLSSPVKTSQLEIQKENNQETHELENSKRIIEASVESNELKIYENSFAKTSDKVNNNYDSKEDSAEHEDVFEKIDSANTIEKSSNFSVTVKNVTKNQQKEITCIETMSFAKSWGQSVRKSSSKIDTIDCSKQESPQISLLNSKQVDANEKALKSNNSEKEFEQEDSTDQEEDENDEDDENKNKYDDDEDLRGFNDDEAIDMGNNYQSGDSMDEEEKQCYAEYSVDNVEGESIGSVDTSEDEEQDDSEDENNSFLASSEEDEESEKMVLEYSDDDEHLNDDNEISYKAKKSKNIYKRLKNISTDTEDENALDFEVTHMIDDTIANEQTKNPVEDNTAEFSSEENSDNDINMPSKKNGSFQKQSCSKNFLMESNECNLEQEKMSSQNNSLERRHSKNNSLIEGKNSFSEDQNTKIEINHSSVEHHRSQNMSLMENEDKREEKEIIEEESTCEKSPRKHRRSQNMSLIENEGKREEKEIIEQESTCEKSPRKHRRSQTATPMEANATNLADAETNRETQNIKTPTKHSLSRNASLIECNEEFLVEEQNEEVPSSQTSIKHRRSQAKSLMVDSECILEEKGATNSPKDEIRKKRHSQNTSLMEDGEIEVEKAQNAGIKTNQTSLEHQRSRSMSVFQYSEDGLTKKESAEETGKRTPKKQRHSYTDTSLLGTKEHNLIEIGNKETQRNKTPAKLRRSQNINDDNFDKAEIKDSREKSSRVSVMENNVIGSEEEHDIESQHIETPAKQRRSRKISLLADNEAKLEKEENAETKKKSPKSLQSPSLMDGEVSNCNDAQNKKTQKDETPAKSRNSRNILLFKSYEKNLEEEESTCCQLPDTSRVQNNSLMEDCEGNSGKKLKKTLKLQTPVKPRHSLNILPIEDYEETVENHDMIETQQAETSIEFHDKNSEKPRRSRKMSLIQAKEDNNDVVDSTADHVIEKPRRSRNISSVEDNCSHLANKSNVNLADSSEEQIDFDKAHDDDMTAEKPSSSRKERRSQNMSLLTDPEHNMEENNTHIEDLEIERIDNHDPTPNKAGKRRSIKNMFDSNEEAVEIPQQKSTMKRQRSKSFIENVNEQKYEKEHKKCKLSVSLKHMKQDHGDINSVVSSSNTTAHSAKEMKLSFEEATEGKTMKIQAENTSTPFINKKTNIFNDNQKDTNIILQRCNEILKETEENKKSSQENKPKEKKKKIKSKTTREMIETAPSSSNVDLMKRAALHQAIQASQNLLTKPTKKRQREQLESQSDENKYAAKRLPVEILAAVSSSDGDSPIKPKKRKGDNFSTESQLVKRNVFKSIHGDLIVESPIHMPKPKRSKIAEVIKTSSGDVRVEPITPLPKKINNAGFRESPITPQATGWKMRQLMKLNEEPGTSQSSATIADKKKRKRRIANACRARIVEPTNILPRPTWTKSAGTFEINKLEHQFMHAFEHTGATQFGIISLNEHGVSPVRTKKSHKQAGSSIAERAMNFRETALYGENTPRENSSNLLRRKRFVH